MIADKGLFTDCLESGQPDGSYRFAKNIVDTNLLGSKENEDGFTDLSVVTPYTHIGTIPVDDNNIVVFSTNNTNSEIGLINLDTSVYATIWNDPDLNFNTSYPIQGEYRKDVNGDRVVTWTDVRNTLRILNIDDLSGVNDTADMDAFQDVSNPSITGYSISNSGGSFTTSAIIPITKYKNSDGSVTNWFVHDHTFYINDDSTAVAFNDDDGAAPGTLTNKLINFTLTGSDTRYDTIVIGYIQIKNNVVTAFSAIQRSNSSTLNITLTGSESTTDVTLDEVLTPTANYSTVETITQLAGQLYAAGLTTAPIPDLQRYALDVRIDYTHSLMDVISNTNSHKDSIPPAFMPGEVYAMYLGVELNKGGWAFYHIPGRDGLPDGEAAFISNYDMAFYKFQVDDTSDKVAQTNMSYWENINETYPNDSSFDASSIGGRDMRNRGVLHHRFPTLDHLMTTYYSGDASVGVTKLVRLGIDVSNVIIPSDIQAQIKRWKIFFAKKDNNNSLVIGSDLWQPSCPIPSDPTLRWTSGGNWWIEGQGPSWTNIDIPVTDTIRGHSLDLLFNTGSITPTYAWFNYKLSRNNLNTQYSGFRSAGARLTIAGEDRGQVASVVIDYTVPAQTTRAGSGFIKSLTNFALLPQNSLSGKFKSQYSEATFVADVNSPGTSFNTATTIRLLTNSSGTSPDPEQFRRSDGASLGTAIAESTFYMQYYRLLSNVHTSFMQQDLVPLEGYYDPSTTSGTFSGGDSFMCYMSYMTAAPLMSNPDSSDGAPFEHGVRAWKAYIGYSRLNLNYRYQTQGTLGTYYHGKTDVRTLFTPIVTDVAHEYNTLVRTDQSLNLINYDTSMNASNIYQVGVIHDPETVDAVEFPNTIIWSIEQNEESKEFSWRTFPAGNRYVIPKNKGDIVNIQGFKNKELLINTEDSFFKTRTDTQMNAEGENVFLKSVSIFDLAPEEFVPTKSGCAGTQHKFGCTLTKAGYAFPDDKRGTIFIYDGDNLEEISFHGNRVFFRDFMNVPQDNPFVSSGYTIGFDPTMNRLILTKRNEALSWTMSYNPVRKTWISYHDYIPNYMFNTLSGRLYSSKSSGFHLHKSGAKGTYYGATYPSYVDLTFTNNQKKLAVCTSWDTQVYPNTYTNGQPDSTLDYNTTCTHLTLKSPDCTTGRVTLSRTTSIYDFQSANIRNIDRIWYYDDIRDYSITQGFIKGFYQNYDIDNTKLNTNLDWFEQRRFIDKFVSCRFEFDNTQNKRWILLEANTTFEDI